MAAVTEEQVLEALSRVNDPEIHRPITELGMVDAVTIGETAINVRLLLTVSGCPLKDKLTRDITAAVATVAPAAVVTVEMGVMTDEQRKGLQDVLRGGRTERDNPFAQAGSLTKVYAMASGNQPSPSTSHSRWPTAASRSASSTPTSMATRFPTCSASATCARPRSK